MTRWVCRGCNVVTPDAELLRAPSPFDAKDTIVGCPACRAAGSLALACDETGCVDTAYCSTQTAAGYRQTCLEHRPKEKAA